MQVAGLTKRDGLAWTLALGLLAATLSAVATTPALAATLDRVRSSGKLTLGYPDNERPFAFKDEAGQPAGFSIALCQKVSDDVKTELALPALSLEWTPMALADVIPAIQQGRIDLWCGAEAATLSRMKDVSFSIAIYPGGLGALLRSDAPAGLREVLEGRPMTGPIWRGNPARVLQRKTFAVVEGSTAQKWLAERIHTFQLDARVLPVENYAAGVASVVDGTANVLFGDRVIISNTAAADVSAGRLVVLDRMFTHEPIALAMARGDDDLRLAVDRTLSRLYGSPEFRQLYAKSFGEPGMGILLFYSMIALPE